VVEPVEAEESPTAHNLARRAPTSHTATLLSPTLSPPTTPPPLPLHTPGRQHRQTSGGDGAARPGWGGFSGEDVGPSSCVLLGLGALEIRSVEEDNPWRRPCAGGQGETKDAQEQETDKEGWVWKE